jgi:hypothetical protein
MPAKPARTNDHESIGKEPANRAGQTVTTENEATAPKQPHERDESSSSQQSSGQQSDPNDLMRKAKADMDHGLADTSRAEATDQTYEKNLRSEPQGGAGKPPRPRT